jgi:hypothetical protein
MARLSDVASLIRSKNAGPFVLTIDIMFADQAGLARARAAKDMTPEYFAATFSVPLEDLFFSVYEPGLAIKVSFPRPVPQGSIRDTDLFGGQFYSPIVDMEVP